jgi:hypothetical protein
MTDLFLSVLWYGGLALGAAGLLFTLRPVRRLGVPTRRRAVRIAISGAAVAGVSLLAGGGLRRVANPVSELDRFVPAFQFSEVHAIEIHAPAERTYRAMLDVTPDEVAFYRGLTWVRTGGQSGPESIMNPPPDRPLIETAVRTSFRKLAEVSNREFVFGGFVAAPPGAGARAWTDESYAALEDPGFAKVAMNFRIEPRGADACILFTETRVYATDSATRRTFKVYWRTIYPGSALIRLSWLRAIKRRAES